MKNSIYISDVVPRHLVKQLNASQASSNFNTHINQLGYFSHHFALPPINVGRGYKCFKEESTGIEYYAYRKFTHKGIFRMLNCFMENLWLFRRVKRLSEQNVWFYNISKINCYAYWLLRIFSKKKLFVLLADYNPNRNKGLYGKMILSGMRHADGIISLTSRCGELNDNFTCIAGIIPQRKIVRDCGTLKEERIFMISGALTKTTGVDLALRVFSNIPESKLVISGKGDEEIVAMCEEYSNKYANIQYFGFFEDYNDFVRLLDSADFILSFRNPELPVNWYNFPSKILESLAIGKIVISTQEYPELEGVNYISLPYSEDALVKEIRSIANEDYSERFQACKNNSKVLSESFTENAWLSAFNRIENNVI